jgi:hypothetical protein
LEVAARKTPEAERGIGGHVMRMILRVHHFLATLFLKSVFDRRVDVWQQVRRRVGIQLSCVGVVDACSLPPKLNLNTKNSHAANPSAMLTGTSTNLFSHCGILLYPTKFLQMKLQIPPGSMSR